MPNTRRCAKCGAPLASFDADALCPKCMMGEAVGLAAKDDDTALAGWTEGIGTRIGPYKLLQPLGRGGMGSVWMAEQIEPVRRMVALKVIKPGMDSANVLARFEAERQALAMMDHANIAKVLEAGATPSGRPYFVMELVKGIPITTFCDQRRLPIRKRLELFMPVCQAIQHAHQKGVIHRDIKPSNVLVALYDGAPVSKVIDFGIAKATGQRLTERTLFTELGMLIGTPEYMSPEQAELNQLDIDSRSDIYSLGVLLYELLTGTTPLTREALRQAAFDEVLRRIREEEPPKPSTRLTESKDQLGAISAQRKLEPEKLTKLVRGDLDWIVMKALEKERSRRYETASGFAQDIRRYLASEPVSAGMPSAFYRLQKFVRRKKTGLAVASVIAVLTMSLLALTFLLFQEFRAGRFGGIRVNSNPEGAEVWREGRKLGITPFELANIPLGEFTYSLVLSNYERVTNTTYLAPKKQMNDFTFLRQLGPLATGPVTNITELTALGSEGPTLFQMEGKVEIARKGTAVWVPAQTNRVLAAGDRLRTGPRSRAALRWSDNSIFRLNELTVIAIPASTNKAEKPALKLNNGTIYQFHRDHGSNSGPITTPAGKVDIRG